MERLGLAGEGLIRIFLANWGVSRRNESIFITTTTRMIGSWWSMCLFVFSGGLPIGGLSLGSYSVD